jgi:hypothetical protein
MSDKAANELNQSLIKKLEGSIRSVRRKYGNTDDDVTQLIEAAEQLLEQVDE